MSLGTAFKFPYSSGNFNKVLQIGLAFGVIAAVEVLLNGGDGVGIGTFVGMVGSILFAMFVSGYGVFVIQNILRGQEHLPDFAIGESIGHGFKIFIASIIYFLPMFILIACIFTTFFASAAPAIANAFEEINRQMANPNYTPNLSNSDVETMGPLWLVFCGALIMLIPLTLVLGFAAQIGIARFAAEDRSGALFEFGTNIKLVFSKFSKVMKLFGLQLVLGIIYFFIGFALALPLGIFGGFGVTSIMPIVFLSILNIVTTILNTAQQISNLHFLSEFVQEADLIPGQEKFKNDDDSYTF